jgi:hypothetical protein
MAGSTSSMWGRLRWNPNPWGDGAGGGAPPSQVAKVGGQYANSDPGTTTPETEFHRGGHAINGMHPPDRLCQPERTPLPL